MSFKDIPKPPKRKALTRKNVAGFAGYITGGMYGDWGDEREAAERSVYEDDAAFFEWAQRLRDFERQRNEGGPVIVEAST